jgi:hypothetical protein
VAEFKHLGMTVRNQNLIQEEIKSRLNSGSACCHSVLTGHCWLVKKGLRHILLVMSLIKYEMSANCRFMQSS